MKKFTREEIENIMWKKSAEITKHTREVLIENIDDYIERTKEYNDLEEKQYVEYLRPIVIGYNTAYQLSMYTMVDVLCELLCDEEKDESADKSDEIVLTDGQSLTVQKGNHRIEITDNGVVVANGELELNK